MKGLTAKQKDMIHFIDRFSVTEGMAPTVQEIANHFDIKTSTVFAHLKALQRKGFITRSPKARSIALSRKVAILEKRKPPVVEIPLVGKLEPGVRPDASKLRAGTVTCDSAFIDGDASRLFAFAAPDDAMAGAGILPGDVVILRETHSIRRGDIVAALVDGKTLLRYYYPAKDVRLELRPANPAVDSVILPLEALELKGKVVGLQRKYS